MFFSGMEIVDVFTIVDGYISIRRRSMLIC